MAKDFTRAATAMPDKLIGHIELTQIVKERMPVFEGNDMGSTFGAMIDDRIIHAIQNDIVLQSITVSITDDAWANMVAQHNRDMVPL